MKPIMNLVSGLVPRATAAAAAAAARGRRVAAVGANAARHVGSGGVVLEPDDDEAVSGTVTVDVEAYDASGIGGVIFEVDGAAVGAEDTSAPWSFAWNADASGPGAHILTVVVRDNAGNATRSDVVPVVVGDYVSPPPPPPVNHNPVAGGDSVDVRRTCGGDLHRRLAARERQLFGRRLRLRKGGRDEPGTPEEEREALRTAAARGRSGAREAEARAGGARRSSPSAGAGARGRAGPCGDRAAGTPASTKCRAGFQQLASAPQRSIGVSASWPRASVRSRRHRGTDEERLAHIEARLAELREAEQLFLRTQQELAGRSEALTARERLVAELEREVGASREDWGGHELAELERRLRKLETERSGVPETTQTFSGGFSRMRRTRATCPSSRPLAAPSRSSLRQRADKPQAAAASTLRVPRGVSSAGRRRLCKPEVAGSIPARSIEKGPARRGFSFSSRAPRSTQIGLWSIDWSTQASPNPIEASELRTFSRWFTRDPLNGGLLSSRFDRTV